MSKITYTFPTPTHKITLTHEKKRRPKYNYFMETITISCIGYSTNAKFYQGLLNADSEFVHFNGVAEFYQYLKKNKKKDIVDIDPRGFLKFTIKGEDG